MSTPQPIEQTIILHLQPDVSLSKISFSSTPTNSNPTIGTFANLLKLIASQPGFVQQFWGHQVEDPTVFVWSIQWASLEKSTLFSNSAGHASFIESMGQLFDFEDGPPLTVYTQYTSSPVAAFTAPVTEVAYFCIPQSAIEDAKKDILSTMDISAHPVFSVGKSVGGAIGFVVNTKNSSEVVPAGKEIVLVGVFGYATVEDHYKWRATPEHAKVIEDSGDSVLSKLGLDDGLKIPGGNIFVEESSMFHVRFENEVGKL